MKNVDVILVGRPNVGKSTLFNRFVGKHQALVHKEPGVTRDLLEGQIMIKNGLYRLIDTPGYEPKKGTLSQRLWTLAQTAICSADVVFWVIEAPQPLLPLDQELCQYLRKHISKPMFILANKHEGQNAYPGYDMASSLNLGPVFPVSAHHGTGLHLIEEEMTKHTGIQQKGSDPPTQHEQSSPHLQIAVIGRPNVGKSTYFNALLGCNRTLTGPEAGLTRDAVYVHWNNQNHKVLLVDTAGLPKRTPEHAVHTMSVASTYKAIDFSHVVVVLLNGLSPLDHQERHVIGYILKEGRGLVLAVNKWDLIHNKKKVLSDLRYDVSRKFPQVTQIPLVPLSAKQKRHLFKPIQASYAVYEQWNKRVATGMLNRWLHHHCQPPPLVKGKNNKVKYITQVNIRPPTFMIDTSYPVALPASYQRYLRNSLAQQFQFDATMVRLMVRGSHNPYTQKKSAP